MAELLELATDYEIDVPMVWEYFAEQLAPVFDADNDGEISINVLETLAAPLQEEGKSGIFVAKIVKELIKRSVRGLCVFVEFLGMSAMCIYNPNIGNMLFYHIILRHFQLSFWP